MSESKALHPSLAALWVAAALIIAAPLAHAQARKTDTASVQAVAETVSLTIRNAGWVSLRIDIPGVMQANFLPKSDSGAGLVRGQELYFLYRGKRTLLTRIDTQKSGDVLLINEIVDKRRAELDTLPENAVTERQPG